MQTLPDKMREWPTPTYNRDPEFDVAADLVEFTGLSPSVVKALLERPEEMRFTDEWQSTPDQLRDDHWFYLASKFYLFANAIHRHAPGCGILSVEEFRSMVPEGSHVLDYAGGSGNSVMSMAACGMIAHYRDLSSLQAAFTRFRASKHKMSVVAHDWWEPLPDDFFDFICFDSIGHVVDQEKELKVMMRALKPGGHLFLSLEDFTVPNAYERDDSRRWSMGAGEQHMHVPNQIGDVAEYLSGNGMEWSEPCWLKAA